MSHEKPSLKIALPTFGLVKALRMTLDSRYENINFTYWYKNTNKIMDIFIQPQTPVDSCHGLYFATNTSFS